MDAYYKIPNQATAVSKKKNRESFIDDFTKLTKVTPSAKYNMIPDWTKNFDKRGKFLKAPKVTFTAGVIHENKRRPKPAPTAYKI